MRSIELAFAKVLTLPLSLTRKIKHQAHWTHPSLTPHLLLHTSLYSSTSTTPKEKPLSSRTDSSGRFSCQDKGGRDNDSEEGADAGREGRGSTGEGGRRRARGRAVGVVIPGAVGARRIHVHGEVGAVEPGRVGRVHDDGAVAEERAQSFLGRGVQVQIPVRDVRAGARWE